MKIGILAYHAACNFGAVLQILSTYCYLKQRDYNPVVINWVPDSLDEYYRTKAPQAQYDFMRNFRHTVWKETELCKTAKDVAAIIDKDGIEAVIVGSDAVIQHHPLRERIIFPSKQIFSIRTLTEDRMFPNVFWGEFCQYLERDIPMAILSASSQDSAYPFFSKNVITKMEEYINRFRYISVRDEWTKEMFYHISNGKMKPNVMPDPVFAFNYNASQLLPSKKEILSRYSLPNDYIVLSLHNGLFVNQQWINSFEMLCEEKGISVVIVPFAISKSYGYAKYHIPMPLSPLDWYALIKYSSGYVGNNMHPIIVSLHNSVPFYCFDNYGRTKANRLYVNEKSSKIYNILEQAKMLDYRVSCLKRFHNCPTPNYVFEKITNFNIIKSKQFSSLFYEKYCLNMDMIIKSLFDVHLCQ